MKIRDIRVKWMLNWSNNPDLEALVDDFPEINTLTYDVRDGLYYAETPDGYVDYFYYKNPGEGFGGQVFHLNMKDGSTAELIGPFSSRAECANERGFGPCIECSLIKTIEGWKAGYTFTACNATLKVINQALRELGKDFYLAKHPTREMWIPHSIKGCYKAENNNANYECEICGAKHQKI